MRKIWLALVPVVLAAGSTTYGQEVRAKKAKARNGEIWAVAHQEANAVVLAPPVSNAPPAINAAPATHAPPAFVAAPAESHHGCAGACDASCGKKCKLLEKCRCLCDWFCYRRARCNKCDDCGPQYYCHPPLSAYFLDHCREGACYSAQSTKPACGSVGCWTKPFSAGHAMFAMPSGFGVCGIR